MGLFDRAQATATDVDATITEHGHFPEVQAARERMIHAVEELQAAEAAAAAIPLGALTTKAAAARQRMVDAREALAQARAEQDRALEDVRHAIETARERGRRELYEVALNDWATVVRFAEQIEAVVAHERETRRLQGRSTDEVSCPPSLLRIVGAVAQAERDLRAAGLL
jgi:hypothetical protein